MNAGNDRSRARSRPRACATSEMTATISASGIVPSFTASAIASKFEPRPERRMASRQRRPFIQRSEATKNLSSGAAEKILRCAQDDSAPGADSTTTRRLPGTTFPIAKKF